MNIDIIKKIIINTIHAIKRYKELNIINTNDINIGIKALDILYDQCNNIQINEHSNLDKINNIKKDLLVLIKSFGTYNLEELLYLLFDIEYIKKLETLPKYLVYKEFIRPISYKKYKKIKNKYPKQLNKNKLIDDNDIVENGKHLDAYDLSRTVINFYIRVYGIKILFESNKEIILINAIVDDIQLNLIDYNYIKDYDDGLSLYKTQVSVFSNYIKSLTIKEKLIYDYREIEYKATGIEGSYKLLDSMSISDTIADFINSDLFSKRSMLIKLLVSNSVSKHYTAYLLYDLLSNEDLNSLDTFEQVQIYNSLPWSIRKQFKAAMTETIEYTQKLLDYDYNKIPLEQKICLLKTDDNVKEKAMTKLKEIKSKPEDSGGKAKHYLEGLLKIPFSIFCSEPILNELPNVLKLIKNSTYDISVSSNLKHILIEINDLIELDKENTLLELKNELKSYKKRQINSLIRKIFVIISEYSLDYNKIAISESFNKLKEYIIEFVRCYIKNKDIVEQLLKLCNFRNVNQDINLYKLYSKVLYTQNNITKYLVEVKTALDKSVYGHEHAKRQIEKVIGQWISGDQTGYALGFEGPPGVGKTSLAKNGIAKCLKDSKGKTRPFSFIAIGGEPNSSTLCGHNYTYVGSNWGKIVDVLIDTKIMNPIFYIDELDKISKTEQGKEIIGILTHLIDSTQNMYFQDRFFSGINLDLSKALFIFSYNDVNSIDHILLDRIHRVKFNHLSSEEKIIIVQQYILPSICKDMNLTDSISMSIETITFIIESYTNEPGVRKLKELIFEILGEINLELLNNNHNHNIPIVINKEDIITKYLKNYNTIKYQKILDIHKIGCINGLWANGMGNGGIILIESSYFLSNTLLDLKLTGRQGDVMKESMNVAKSLAWSILDLKTQQDNLKYFKKTQNQGIHIHAPEGATPKDGPSAGTAITIALYSLFSNKPIKNTIAITGEINLSGQITAIGGLDLKIIGGIRAGVKQFLFPKENMEDYNKFLTKYEDNKLLDGIAFNSVNNIKEVIDLIFD